MCEGNNNSVQWKRCGCECYKTKACCDECCGGDIHNIGNGCLLSNNIELHTSDYHSILDIKAQHASTPPKTFIWATVCG